LDNRVENITNPQAKGTETDDWNVYPGESSQTDYKRYAVTESGISPRAVPGMEGYVFSATGLEHAESGNPDYTAENHMRMTEKRHRKIQGALTDLFPPEAFSPEGPLDVGVIAWGSTFGSALEAVQKGQKRGLKIGALKVTSIFPYHGDEIRTFMDRCGEILIPELNYEGQLANLIGHLHKKDVVRLNRATGTPLPPSVILERIEQML